MAKPTKHYDTWRIRWTDENGKRRSQTFTDRKTADLALRKAEIAVEERRRGLRPPEIEPRRFAQAAEYWRQHRAPLKRSEKDDLSILNRLEVHFGQLLLNDTASWLPAIDRYRAMATQEDKTISKQSPGAPRIHIACGAGSRVGRAIAHHQEASSPHTLDQL